MSDWPADLKPLLERMRPLLGANDAAFLGRVFERPRADYARRAAGWGFSGLGRVLDAGCGFGQWSLALASQNERVEAIDVQAERAILVDQAAAACGVTNLGVRRGPLTALPYEDASFDGVFCYGVLFLTQWREGLAELVRVLAPGGRIYVNGNGAGWYRHLWKNQPNRADDYEPRELVARVYDNTWRYERGLPIEEGWGTLFEAEELAAALAELGCREVTHAAEGGLWRGEGDPPAPFFRGEYEGEAGVFEVTATR